MSASTYTEWCNENEGRAYPLSETATRLDDSGLLLPDNIIADMSVVLPRDHAGLRVSSVYVSPEIVSVAVSSDSGGLLVGSFAVAAVSPYRAYPLTPVADDVSGWVVFGNFSAPVPRRFRFGTAAQAQLEARTVRVIPPPGVNRILRLGGDPGVYAGDVVSLEASPELEIVGDPVDPQRIIVRLRSGTGRFVEDCALPATADNCGVPPIRRINNVAADESGKITLRFQ